MMQPLQPGSHLEPHLEPDQLTAFAEGALTPAERQQSLAHLNTCAACREVLFLAQQAIPPEELPQPAPVPFWRRWSAAAPAWFGPLPITAAALSCALILFLALRPHQPAAVSPAPVEVARDVPAPPIAAEAPLPPTPHPISPRPAIPPPSTPAIPPPPAPAPAPSRRLAPDDALSADSSSSNDVAARSRMAPVAGVGSPAAGSPQYAAAGAAAGTAAAAGNTNASALATVPTSHRTAAPSLKALRIAPQPSATAGKVELAIQHNRTPTDGLSELTGSITDPTGAAIAGASVTLQSLNGAAPRSTRADVAGRFTLAALPPGRYQLLIAKPGFATASRSIELASRDLAQLDTSLAVGAESTTLNVEASNADLQTMSASTGTTVDAVTVEALPSRKSPGKPPALTTVTSGARTLTLDAAGSLFVSQDGGAHWKHVKQPGKGTIQRLALTSTTPSLFQLTLADGSVWTSADGKHWQQ
jgi:hypothetical protein